MQTFDMILQVILLAGLQQAAALSVQKRDSKHMGDTELKEARSA